jgi:type VI secretion system secreted protein VgrG
MTDPFSVTSSALPAGVRVLSFRGTEAISALYSFEMHLLVEDPTFDPAAAIGADATFTISGEDPPRAFHGVLSTLEIVNDLPHSAVVRAVLTPRLWRLTLTRHSRVFVKQSLPAMLDAVLKGAGLTGADYALELTGTYGPLEHVCQYRESSLAFLSRRMEREGVYFFFEQGDTREKLIIADDRSCHERLSKDPVRYYQVAGAGVGGGNGLHAFRGVHSSIPGSVRVHDYDYLRPTLDMTSSAPVSDTSP